MKIHRRTFAEMLAGLGLSFVFTGISTGAMAQAKTVDVTMKQGTKSRFDPETVTVAAGDTVKWTNPAFVAHTVTFDPSKAQKASDVSLPAGVAPFDSGTIEEDGTFSHTFTVKGTYKYVCVFHEAMGMVGTVVVT
jgi:plastocyanin